MAVEHCKHANPIIYMFRVAVPEARRTFLARGQTIKTLKFLREKSQDWLTCGRNILLSGLISLNRGLILKTISWQTFGPLPLTL